MFIRDICRTLAYYFWILLIPLCIPMALAIYCDWLAPPGLYPQPHSAFAFAITMVIAAVLGAIFYLLGKKGTGQLYRREAILLVLIIYFLTPAIGGLPFFLNRTLKSPLDSYFEAVSGLTTTGATLFFPKKYNPGTGEEIPYEKTIDSGKKTRYTFYGTISPLFLAEEKKELVGFEAVGYPLLFWRTFMQWLGGGGIIVLFVAILPALGVGGKVLFQTEITGPSKESMLPRIKETASKLWKIYLILTCAEVVLLLLTNSEMSLFDALTLSMATLSTGGLTTKNAGVAYYNSLSTDCILMLFMILGSINFSIYFYCMRGRFGRLRDPEVQAFLCIIFFSSLFAAWQLTGQEGALLHTTGTDSSRLHFFQALRYGAFQIISAQTSTGFATADFDLWPFSVQTLMLVLMYVGGMAGSTAGGLKVIRFQTFFYIMLAKIESIFRPDTIRISRIGTSIIDHKTATTVLCFILIAASLTILGTFSLILDGVDPETALTTISCMANNGGIAFRMGGPTESFAFLTPFGKILSCVWMIAGRLEYFALLVVFVPAFWRTTY